MKDFGKCSLLKRRGNVKWFEIQNAVRPKILTI